MKRLVGIVLVAALGGLLWALPAFGPSDYVIAFAARLLALALLAGSFNLLMSFTGMVSFGHSAFFGVGSYAVALLYRRDSNPDAAWALLLAFAVAACVAAALAPSVLRTSGVYFVLLSLALGQVIWGIVDGWRSVTGGTDGVIIAAPLWTVLWPLDTAAATLRFTIVVGMLGLAMLYVIVTSPFGAGLTGVRESPIRMQALGFDVFRLRYLAFVLACGFAGVAGGLLAIINRFTSPDSMSVRLSVELPLIVILGGKGSFWGPLVAAVLLFTAEELISVLTPMWPLVLGLLFMTCVYVLRYDVMRVAANHHLFSTRGRQTEGSRADGAASL